jgi:hypothetical protein
VAAARWVFGDHVSPDAGAHNIADAAFDAPTLLTPTAIWAYWTKVPRSETVPSGALNAGLCSAKSQNAGTFSITSGATKANCEIRPILL